MKVTSIVSEGGEDKTTKERAQELVQMAQEALKTGPIIGEAKELLEYFSLNLLVRDMTLDALGVDLNERQRIFFEITKMAKERDEEIMKKRKQ